MTVLTAGGRGTIGLCVGLAGSNRTVAGSRVGTSSVVTRGCRLLDGRIEVRDWGLLESALVRPAATAFGEDAYPDVWSKAAALLLLSLVGNHALVDGNKRVGFTCTALFLPKDGVDVTFH